MKLHRVTPKLIKLCPNCGSGDVDFCNISHRPHCNECKYWPPVNFGGDLEAIVRWNNHVIIDSDCDRELMYIGYDGLVSPYLPISMWIAKERFW